MPDVIDPHDEKSGALIQPDRKPLGVGSGIALGCAINLVFAVALLFLLLAVLGFFRVNSGKFITSAYLGLMIFANAVVIVVAHRRKERGVVIGFAIVASLVVLLGGICWSSFS